MGLANFAALQRSFAVGLGQAGQFLAGQALSVGQLTLDFITSLFIAICSLPHTAGNASEAWLPRLRHCEAQVECGAVTPPPNGGRAGLRVRRQQTQVRNSLGPGVGLTAGSQGHNQ